MSLRPLELNPIRSALRALIAFRRDHQGRQPVEWRVSTEGLMDLRLQDRANGFEDYLRRTPEGGYTLLGIPVVEEPDGPRDAQPVAATRNGRSWVQQGVIATRLPPYF